MTIEQSIIDLTNAIENLTLVLESSAQKVEKVEKVEKEKKLEKTKKTDEADGAEKVEKVEKEKTDEADEADEAEITVTSIQALGVQKIKQKAENRIKIMEEINRLCGGNKVADLAEKDYSKFYKFIESL